MQDEARLYNDGVGVTGVQKTAKGHSRKAEEGTIVVGREHETLALRDATLRALRGQASLAFVSGEIGIGKTTLVREISDEAAAGGVRVVSGLCYDLEMTRPYSPWIDLARLYHPEAGEPTLPESIRRVVDGAVPPSTELAGQFEDFLTELAGTRGLLLVLEDLHWSDQASLELLRILARRVRELPIAIVATYRDTDLTPEMPLYRMLPALVREPRATRVNLHRLSNSALRTLVDQHYQLPDPDAQRLVDYLARYAEGNPFFTEEVLYALEADRILSPVDRSPNGVAWTLGDLEALQMPPLVQQVIEGRLSRLDETTREALQIASVIGQEIPLPLWQQLTELDDDQLAATVEAAMVAGLIDEVPNRQGLAFNHALVREALYNSLFLLRRRGLHRRIAEIMSSDPLPDPDTIAHHFYLAGDQRAADWLILAGRRSIEAAAYMAAAARFGEALVIFDRDASRLDDHTWLLFETAEAYRYIDTGRALGYLDTALDRGREAGDKAVVAVGTWLRGRIRAFAGENSVDELDEGVRLYEALSEDDRVRIAASSLRHVVSYGTLSQMLAHFGRHREAIDLANRFLEMLARGQIPRDPNEIGEAHMALALSYAAIGDVERARVEFAASRRRREEVGNPHGVAGAYDWEYVALDKSYFADNAAAGRRTIQLADEYWARSDFARLIDSQVIPHITEGHILLGEWTEARRRAETCLEIPILRTGSMLLLTELDQLQGNYDQALVRIRAALPNGPDTAPSVWLAHNTMEMMRVAFELELERGNLERASEWAATYGQWARWTGRLPALAKHRLIDAALARARGDFDTATRYARDVIQLATKPRQPLPLMTANRLLGELAVERGELSEASKHLGDALAIAEAAEAPYEIARCKLALARHAAASGDRQRADELLDAATTIAQELGARPLLAEIERAGSVAAVASQPKEIPGGLSPREVDVLRLVARGMTDAEVAQALSISPRTVGRHLSSVYSKLGVSSRTAATAFAFEHGLARD